MNKIKNSLKLLMFLVVLFNFDKILASEYENEINCYDALKKAHIIQRSKTRNMIRLCDNKNFDSKGIYLVDNNDSIFCPFPKTASTESKTYKIYDLKLNIGEDKRPLKVSMTIQHKKVGFAASLNRIHRSLASKTYKDVNCKSAKKSEVKKMFIAKFKETLPEVKQRYHEKYIYTDDDDLFDFNTKYTNAKKACQKVEGIEKLVEYSFKGIASKNTPKFSSL